MEKVSCALIISTYNRPDALELCLLSVMSQDTLPDEILIADDGSEVDTRDLIESYRERFPVTFKHIWHPDEGFRLASIRNKAIANVSSDYIIQIDGDLILHQNFISDHLRFAKQKTFVRASRIYMDKELSQRLLQEKNVQISIFTRGLSNKLSALRLPFIWKFFEYRYKNKGDERYEIHGCNMAYWRKDAIAVNGYNEEFTGWGPEDKEFVVRMLNSGSKRRFIKMGALVFHLYHSESSKDNLQKNELIFKSAIANKISYSKIGLNQYLPT
jgi:glycosyltransferase involved in cell wall biosynthesis